MARTSPAPNIPPIPGMCPGVAVAGGGGGGGGAGGKGSKKGKGKKSAGKKKGKNNAKGGGKKGKGSQKAKDCGKGGCGNPHSSKGKGDPVDVLSGAVTTLPISLVELPGPLPLSLTRQYNSHHAEVDVGLGFGWTHSLAWTLEVRARSLVIHDPDGEEHLVDAVPRVDETIPAPNGWRLHRTSWGYVLDLDDDLFHVFSVNDTRTHRWLLSAIEDHAKNRILLTYEDGLLVEVLDSVGRRVHFNRERSRHLHTMVVAPGGSESSRTIAEFTYDANGDLRAVTDAAGAHWRYAYLDHLLVRQTDRIGGTFYYAYDAARRCVETWGDLDGRPDPSISPEAPSVLADGRTRVKGYRHVRFDYVLAGYSEVIDSTSVERFEGAPEGAIALSAVGSCVTDIVYTEAGHVAEFADGAGGRTTFERDERGRLLRSTDPAGRTTTVRWDDGGHVVEVVDPKGVRTIDSFDYRGFIESHQDPDGAVTTYRHDERGLLVEENDPVGARTLIAYDRHGNAIELQTPDGARLQRTYDAYGNCTSEADGYGNRIFLAYDEMNRCTSRTNADGSRLLFEYDAEGRLIRQGQDGYAPIVLTYGIHEDVHTIRDELGNTVVFEYGLEGQLLRIVDEKQRTYRCSWDACGNLRSEQFFDGREVSYSYDAANRLTLATVERGQTVAFEYDAAGQVVRRSLPDGEEEYEYDAVGDIVAIKTADVQLTYVRDPIGRVIEEHQTVGGETVSIWTRYDASGEEIERRSSLGHVDVLRRDANGNVIERQVNGHRLTAQYDGNGRRVGLAADGLGVISSEWSSAGYLACRRILTPDGAPLAERLTEYDLAGSLHRVTDSRMGELLLDHDAMGRLTRARRASGVESYSYDECSNVRRDGEHRAYSSGDRLDELDDTRFMWSDNGCLMSRTRGASTVAPASTHFEWASDGRLAAVSTDDGSRIQFTYDPFGRRHTKRVQRADGTQHLIRFVWDGDVLLHERSESLTDDGRSEQRLRTYVFDDDLVTPIAHETLDETNQASLTLYETDALGTPIRLLTRTGVEDVDIDTWGMASASATNLRFPGQYFDSETGLSYNKFRYYDPETCRFISTDPSGLDGGLNPFVAPWDPYSLCDPDGLRFSDATKKKAMEKARGPDGKVHCQAEGCGKVVVKGKKSVSKTLPNGKPNPAYKKPPPNEMQFDHKKPRAKGGSDSARNCQVMCRKCNRGKSDKY